MRWFRIALLVAGIALFAWLLQQVDTHAMMAQVRSLGRWGFVLVLALFAFEFLIDVVSWRVLLGPSAAAKHRGEVHWIASLYAVRMAGEAVNVLTPLGGMGGEPVKALILHRHHGIEIARGAASLVLAKTVNVLALVVFLAVSFVLMVDDDRIDAGLRSVAIIGLVALTTGILLFVLVQRIGFRRLMARVAPGRSPRMQRALAALESFDAHLVACYTTRPGPLMAALVLGFLNWVIGSLSIFIACALMQHPVQFTDAWVIEGMTQMVRAATFVIPASIGAQDGAMVLALATLAANPGLGLALALVRRARELVWIAIGGWLTWHYLKRFPLLRTGGDLGER